MNERMNIRRMHTLEKREGTNIPFDPERDLTPDDWQGMYREVQAQEKARRTYTYLVTGSQLKTLRPQEKIKYSASVLGNFFTSRIRNRDWDGYTNIAAALKIIDPSYQLPFAVENKAALREATKWTVDPKVMAKLTLIDPEFKISDDTFQHIRNNEEKERGRTEYYKKMANLRIASGGKAIPLNEMDWKHMRQILETYRLAAVPDGKYDEFAEFASSMKVLAAEEVKVSDKGLEIIMQKSKTEVAGDSRKQPEPIEL
jgi:hypothetical protein